MKIIDQRIESTKQAIEYARESRDNETKCSSGDKYETGRTMMNFELEKSRMLLNKTLNTKNDFLTCFMKVVTFFIVYSIIIFLFGLDNRIFFFGLNSDTIPIVLTSSTILFQRMIVIEELIDICGCKN